jgi:RNA polymerase sigma factor (sigma-70 family)
MKEVTTSIWSNLSGPGVAQEMLRDANSPSWEMCREAVSNLVGREIKRRGLPSEKKEDIVQATMLAVVRGLPSFRGGSNFTSWLTQITVRKAIDEQRLQIREREHSTSLEELEETESETAWQQIADSRTVEDDVLVREQLDEALAGLRDFLSGRRKAVRDEKVLDAVLIDDRKCGQIALELGVDPQVVRNVIYAARQYLKDQHRPNSQAISSPRRQSSIAIFQPVPLST